MVIKYAHKTHNRIINFIFRLCVKKVVKILLCQREVGWCIWKTIIVFGSINNRVKHKKGLSNLLSRKVFFYSFLMAHYWGEKKKLFFLSFIDDFR